MKELFKIVAAALGLAAFGGSSLRLHWSLVSSALVGMGTYCGTCLLLILKRRAAAKREKSTAQKRMDVQLLQTARTKLDALGSAVGQIDDPVVRGESEQLYGEGQRICAYLRENPSKLSQARSFLLYYLDAADQLLERYVQLQGTGLRSEQIMGECSRITHSLPQLRGAFQRQFGKLVKGSRTNLESDIEMVEKLLKEEA